jgi:hypothetical protein
MLEKPEDVLHKRIKELENLEGYLRQQVSLGGCVIGKPVNSHPAI